MKSTLSTIFMMLMAMIVGPILMLLFAVTQIICWIVQALLWPFMLVVKIVFAGLGGWEQMKTHLRFDGYRIKTAGLYKGGG